MNDTPAPALPAVPLGHLLDGIPHGVTITDRTLRIVAVNRFLETLIGVSRSDSSGLDIDSVLRSSIANRGRTFREIIDGGTPAVLDGDIISRDRRRIPIRFTVTPLRDEEETVAGLMVILEDLSVPPAANETLKDATGADCLIGQSPKMQEALDLIPLLAQTEASVLITGETGTGKDRIAEIIHKQSVRAKKPFIKINCGALPEALLESELFGYVKGAFTGAVKDKAGMFEMAQGGTLFLTEIGDMPLPLQVKLLSVLDDREFYPLGGEKKIIVDVRIIAATHRGLRERVKTGEFREDLYYRLNILSLHLPPLRERETDTRFLLNHFLRALVAKSGARIKSFSEEALNLLTTHPFPGNVRELRNIVEYCVNICPQEEIAIEHLPLYLLHSPAKADPAPTPAAGQPPLMPRPAKGWRATEKELIVNTLIETAGNRVKAAELLGWGRTTLWRKLKFHGLAPVQPGKAGSKRIA
jgi:transcriptional regulator with PAS, ATPase and Fis domain